MKKIFSALLLLLILVTASAMVPVDEKVLQIFNETFRGAKNVVWNESDDYYSVSFIENNVRANITYDKTGRFIGSKRYYHEDYLPFHILMRVKEKYKARSIFGVTEIVNEGVITYYIKLENGTHFWLLKATSDGFIQVVEKMKKV